MPLSFIGKKVEEEKKKKLPSIQEIIDRETQGTDRQTKLPEDLPPSSFDNITTPKTTFTPEPLRPEPQKEEVPRLSNIERQRIFEGQTLTQGTEDPVVEFRKENPLRKIPAFGEFIFGAQGEGRPLYWKGSFQQQFVDQGLVGFLTEGFTREMNPTRKELGEKIDQRYSKFRKEGYDEQEAIDFAVQDVLKNTPGTAENLSDLKNPDVELTDKEEGVLTWINLTEDIFSVLDAPVFIGSTKPVKGVLTAQGERLSAFVESTKDTVLKRLKEQPAARGGEQVDILQGADEETQNYIEFLEQTANPSLNEINQGLELLRLQGKQVDDIQQGMDDIVFDIKTDPAPYIQDPVTGKMKGRRKVNVQETIDETLDTTQLELSTRIVDQLEGKTTVSKQFISDLTNSPDIKDAERQIIREVLEEFPEGKVNAKEFGEKVQSRLLPLNSSFYDNLATGAGTPQYENVNLPTELRGEVSNYSERVYESPIKNSAGNVHNFETDSYFAHTRVEDMADNSTRRVIEVQSDLFQKGRLEGEFAGNPLTRLSQDEQAEFDKLVKSMEGKAVDAPEPPRLTELRDKAFKAVDDDTADSMSQIGQLKPYRNTWWERVVREEVKKAAEDGKGTLQFPTGETAMKIEGLGGGQARFAIDDGSGVRNLTQERMGVGLEITDGASPWIITEVLDDGKFKAVPKSLAEAAGDDIDTFIKELPDKPDYVRNQAEQFDISGKVDTNNPIYKFYEKDVQKYLKKNYDADVVTDDQGVSWVQMNVNPSLAGQPVQAFAGLPAGYEEDEEGNITVDPAKAFLGMAAAGFLGKRFNRGKTPPSPVQGRRGLAETRRAESKEIEVPKKGQTEYPLGTEKYYSSLSNKYQEITGESISEGFTKIDNLGNIDRNNLSSYTKFKQSLFDAHVDAVEYVQDDMYRVKLLVEDPNVKITDDSDPYMAEILFHGRVGARLEKARDTVIKIDRQIIDQAGTNGIPERDMATLVNKYLHARHTPERNAALGDGASGIKTADAEQIKTEIEALPYSSDVIRIADDIQELNNQTLDILLEGQVIDRELYDTLKTKYKNHVPLQRILSDDQDIVQVIAGKGFDVRSTGIKKAKGSDKDVADILANVVTNFEQAVIKAEKNRMDLSTLQFARDNKNLGLFEEVKPKVIGKRFDEVTGEEGVITERIYDPRVLELRENGKPVYLMIKDDNLAMALKGVNREKIGNTMLKGVQFFTRTYSGLQTRFNPEFAFPNKIRDLQEMIVYAGSRSELGFKGGVKASLRRDAYKGVLDYVRGADTDAARLYEQMIEDGGTTGGIALSTREAIELDIQNIRKINRSNPRAAAETIIRKIDDFNRIFEDSTRLAVYREAIDRGVSRKRAAVLAKEASVNFNKLGKGGPLINALWMFSNAGIQGTTKFLRAMRNPKVAAITASSVGAAVTATGEWNDMLDPEWRDKTPSWDRTNSLVVVLPPNEDGDFDYVAIPVAWGIKPMKVAMDYAYDLASGIDTEPSEIAKGVLGAIVNAYNPIGGTDLLSAATPTFLDIPSEIYRNQAWHGGVIRPDWDKRKDHLQYFSDLADTTTGEATIEITEGLSGLGIEVSPASMYYAYQGYLGGAGRTANDFVNTMISLGRGEMPDPNDIPIWGRFVKKRDNEVLGAGSQEFNKVNELLIEQDSERAMLNFEAEKAFKRMSEMEQEEAADMFDRIAEKDPDLAKEITDLYESKEIGLTSLERRIKNLGVSNGVRAQYIYERINSLETEEEKAALWDEYVEKKLISDNVAEQITELMNQ